MKKLGKFIFCALIAFLLCSCQNPLDVVYQKEHTETVDKNNIDNNNIDKTTTKKSNEKKEDKNIQEYDEEYYKSVVENFYDAISDREKMETLIENQINITGVIIWYQNSEEFLTNINKSKIDKNTKQEVEQFLLTKAETNADNSYKNKITDIGNLEEIEEKIYKMVVGVRFKENKNADWKFEEQTFIFYDGKIIDISSEYDEITKSFFNSVLAPNFFELNEKYYLVGDKYGFSLTFKKNGDIDYHLDKAHTENLCDDSCLETEPGCCEKFTFNDQTIQELYDDKNYYIWQTVSAT